LAANQRLVLSCVVKTYMPQLDSIRAFAILVVLIHHFLPVDKIIPTDFHYARPGRRAFVFCFEWISHHRHLVARARRRACPETVFTIVEFCVFFRFTISLLLLFLFVSPYLRSEGAWLATYTTIT